MTGIVLSRLGVLRAMTALLLVIMASLTGCGSGSGSPPGTSGKLNVVATTTQIRSIAESVAGDLADVRSILTPGADAHEFEPRPSDVAAITTATLVLKNGVGLDDWIDKIIQNAGVQRPLI